jgi:hypothetical protein
VLNEDRTPTPSKAGPEGQEERAPKMMQPDDDGRCFLRDVGSSKKEEL